ncbi:MAG: heptosyltransferase [Sulfurimonas sp. RIFOXYD12_FULL_33_39]|uniref:glycosyltransferase family 9 protein n=1 Tax=unclassified Sulfurimonas TaxID=2623549 RepID=UPI0008C91BEB|nr:MULTISPECIES: glycosyltransferase family 9 protein [unclassified Sulfurimonas]OHE03400.1 MAG: heptosyltransferase [Sulfurimonas sp. RIFCSPLOWO2_12_FULL_34_6]OHE09064.1 MAG: heptosyltransferase [Sulfurimonas sp. RIFOXYD12_FULL_33_39]OHE14381.1 MAG: heptosyltransferase [Sulfurimonas sp. RIFOXYD2_FULL_34_21]
MNILVVRNDKLGDFITALPAVYVLKQHNPNNRVVVCVAPLNRALAEACDFIDEVIVDNGGTVFELAKKLQNAKIDVSITLFSNTRVALAQFLAGIPKRIAPATKIAQIFYNKRVVQRRSKVEMAEFEYNLELTRALFNDISLEYKKPLLAFSDAKKIYEVFCLNNDIEKEVVAFHVGFGGSSDANWNLDEYEILIREVIKQDKYQVVLTFGPDEKELYEEMQKRLYDVNAVFYLSLEGLVYFAKLVSNFKLFISTSTGTYHVASLVGTPTMTFFADSLFASAARWKSVGDIKLQKHYMIPSEKEKKDELFEEVKRELSRL